MYFKLRINGYKVKRNLKAYRVKELQSCNVCYAGKLRGVIGVHWDTGSASGVAPPHFRPNVCLKVSSGLGIGWTLGSAKEKNSKTAQEWKTDRRQIFSNRCRLLLFVPWHETSSSGKRSQSPGKLNRRGQRGPSWKRILGGLLQFPRCLLLGVVSDLVMLSIVVYLGEASPKRTQRLRLAPSRTPATDRRELSQSFRGHLSALGLLMLPFCSGLFLSSEVSPKRLL